ncbi:MAG: PQQ-binding-like beta-propeller repeat protein, partial [Deltaproteobacteria bacterium]|nr:PQQ-binding-like beta-propeller repeat protein [Deltaproteobacteria bacterium]
CGAEVVAISVLGLFGLFGPLGCASVTVREPKPSDERAAPAGIVHVRWRTEIHAHKLFEPRPEECASGALAGDRLVIGSRAGSIVGVRVADGHVDWATATSGGIDGPARFDAKRGQVYVGADDGSFYAVDPLDGRVRWTYRAKGSIEREAEIGADAVYVATAADRVVSLDAVTGKWRWQYERETPDGFTIHGYGAPRLRGSQLLVGFADGNLVSLQTATGDISWTRSLASVSDQFVDVDSTPVLSGETMYAASYSGGVYGLNAKDGAVRWRLATEGAGPLSLIGGRLFFAAPRDGLHAISTEGQILWRQGLADAGTLTAPMALGRYLVFSGSRGGLFIVDATNGDLLEIFNPGQGICAAATLDPSGTRLFVLSNSGTLYALDIG